MHPTSTNTWRIRVEERRGGIRTVRKRGRDEGSLQDIKCTFAGIRPFHSSWHCLHYCVSRRGAQSGEIWDQVAVVHAEPQNSAPCFLLCVQAISKLPQSFLGSGRSHYHLLMCPRYKVLFIAVKSFFRLGCQPSTMETTENATNAL